MQRLLSHERTFTAPRPPRLAFFGGVAPSPSPSLALTSPSLSSSSSRSLSLSLLLLLPDSLTCVHTLHAHELDTSVAGVCCQVQRYGHRVAVSKWGYSCTHGAMHSTYPCIPAPACARASKSLSALRRLLRLAREGGGLPSSAPLLPPPPSSLLQSASFSSICFAWLELARLARPWGGFPV